MHPAFAQQLPRLWVDALGMHADRTVAPVAAAVHVTIHVHVREQVANFDELVLPDLANLQILGDERRMHADATGTDYVELLTVVGLSPGIAHLSPAHLDAIDDRTGQPTRFSSNDLTIRIDPEGATPSPPPGPGIGRALIAAVLMAVGIVAGSLALLVFLVVRRVRAVAPPPARIVAMTVEPASEPPSVRRAIEELRTARTRAAVFGLRAAVRDLAGAREDETLEAVLARLDGAAPALRAALRLAERAAFVPDERLQTAIDEFLGAAENVAPA